MREAFTSRGLTEADLETALCTSKRKTKGLWEGKRDYYLGDLYIAAIAASMKVSEFFDEDTYRRNMERV